MRSRGRWQERARRRETARAEAAARDAATTIRVRNLTVVPAAALFVVGIAGRVGPFVMGFYVAAVLVALLLSVAGTRSARPQARGIVAGMLVGALAGIAVYVVAIATIYVVSLVR